MIIIVGKLTLLYGISVLHCLAEDIHPKPRVNRLIYDQEVMSDREEYYAGYKQQDKKNPSAQLLIIR